MRGILFGLFSLSLSLTGAPLAAAETTYTLADGRFTFAVPADWRVVAQEQHGPREYLGFLVDDDAKGSASRIQAGLFSFCLERPEAVAGAIQKLKEESRDQFRFHLNWDGQVLNRYQGYFYTAQPWREKFFIADYYLTAGTCGLQVRFALPSRGSEGFDGTMTRFLESVQAVEPNGEQP